MAVPRALQPLTSAATPRRGVLLVIGGVLAAAYALLVTGFAQMYADTTVPRSVVTVLAIVTAAITLTPPFLHSVRVLGALAARTFLDADLPALPGTGASATARGAAWFAAHVLAGALAVLALLVCVPVAVALVARQVGVTALGTSLGPLLDLPVIPAVLLAAVALVLPAYLFWWLGELLRRLAPVLLGPSAQERIALLEEETRRLAARNALARDLHDSVGHALTVTALQAAAAERALDRDPEFVRSALAAIAATGRDAAAELDRALGVLRTEEPPSAAAAAANDRTLADLPTLVAELRTAGAEVTATLPPCTDRLPPLVSRAGYAVVREATTNALRHGDGTIELEVAFDGDGDSGGDAVRIEVTNGLPGAAELRRHAPDASGVAQTDAAGVARTAHVSPGGTGSGRGLAGMRERALALGGEMTWGIEAGRWTVRARLPGEAP